MPTHEERISFIVDAYRTAQERLVLKFEDATDKAARAGEWTPAQLLWHVATSTERLTTLLTGERAVAKPAPPDFVECWDAIQIPPKVKTFAALEPPAGVTPDAAVAKLRASGDKAINAIRALTPERAHHIVEFPFGPLSLYQVAEFITKHVDRHTSQLERML